MIALIILAISLSVLLSAQSSSMAAAGRSRDITIGTLLARSKMIDIEKKLVDEGFVSGSVENDGDFGDEGFAPVKWKYKVVEIELDISLISQLCEGFNSDKDKSASTVSPLGGSCDSVTSALGGSLSQLTTAIGQSMRLVDLTVTIPSGKGAQKVELRSLVTREDMNIAQSSTTGVPGIDPTLGGATTGTTGSTTGTTSTTGSTTGTTTK
ncbi:MAG: hypothetical protein H7Z43_05835 [Clostridia bacterium]|nr:hypothetical protein [Deltaproteobacteria bacterium]